MRRENLPYRKISFTESLHRMLKIKNNYADPDGLEYKIDTVPLPIEGESEDVPYVKWLGRCKNVNADALLASKKSRQSDDTGKLELAQQFLSEFLKNGPRLATDCMEHAKEVHNISERTLNSAKQALEISSTKANDKKGKWIWALPATNPAFTFASASKTATGEAS